LSSVEILVLDQGDVFSMQSWEHLSSVLALLNPKQPREQSHTTKGAVYTTDFGRLRPWYTEGWSKFYRQTLIFSNYTTVDLNSFFNKQCYNWSGRIKIRPEYSGILSMVVPVVRQIFHRVECDNVSEQSEKFSYFMNELFPKVKAGIASDGHTLLFIPSYFDFVKIRNAFKANRVSFCNCSEYTKVNEVSRSRSFFQSGERKVLLLTERFFFFRRYRIRGVFNVIFYGLPVNAHFYAEVLNFIQLDSAKAASGTNSCLVLFTRYDALELERVVGTQRCNKLLNSATQQTHMFL